MRELFLWFYCLPIPDVVILAVLGTVGFLYLREEAEHTRYWKTGIRLLLLCWLAVIFCGTLGQRTEGGNLSAPILTPFYSYRAALNGGSPELYRTNLMNVVLFYPAGLLGYEALPGRWGGKWKALLVVFVFALMSMAVEYTQYRLGLGLAEVDDVIHNTLGALLGALAYGISVSVMPE